MTINSHGLLMSYFKHSFTGYLVIDLEEYSFILLQIISTEYSPVVVSRIINLLIIEEFVFKMRIPKIL